MKTLIAAMMLALSFAALVPATDALARRGADDPAGQHHGEGPGHK